MTPRFQDRLVLPTLPGTPSVLPPQAHLVLVIVVVVVGVLSGGLTGLLGPVADIAAWVLVGAGLGAVTILLSLVTEHVRYLRRGRPRPPVGAEVLVPRPASSRPGRRTTPRGLVRRARLWADEDGFGVVDWLHGETRWTRTEVAVLRVVRGPGGEPIRLDLLGERDRLLGLLMWCDWFSDDELDRLREFARRSGVPVQDEAWHRRLGVSRRPVDGADDFGSHVAQIREIPHVMHAAGLGIVGVLCAVQAGRPSGGPGLLGTVLGLVCLASAVAVVVAAVAVVWWDQGVVRRRPEDG